MATITKGQIQRQDQDSYDGTLATTRTDATGGTLTGLKVGDTVDVLSVFGGGLTANQTRSTIATATAGLSGTNIALQFAPGTWTIDDDLTIASNFTVVVPAGCVFSVAAGKTLTIAGILDRHHETYTAGSGTVTVSGTDLMAATENTRDYALDTGAANTYTIAVTPSVTSYVAGRQFRFKSANASTGASTLNVDSLGAKSIVQADGSTALSANDIVADQIVTVNYDGVDDEFHMVPTSQAVANPARTDTDNVYTKTQTWKQGADVASATALPVDVDGNLFDVTGTTTVTSIKTKGIGTIIVLQFDGILTLTHHATNLILPLSANITTAAGDTAVLYEYSAGSWRLVSFTTLTGKGADIASASDLDVQIAGTSFDVTGTTQIDTIKTKGIGTTITLQFDGILILAHDATNLDLLSEANITTAAGDIATFIEYASADWRMVSYGRADGTALADADDLEFVSTDAITASTTLAVTGLAAGYDYIVTLEAIAPTDDTEVVWMRFSDDAGVSYEADAGDYQWGATRTGTGESAETDAEIAISGAQGLGNDASNVSTVQITLMNPNASGEQTTGFWDGFVMSAAATPVVQAIQGGFFFKQGTDAVDAVQFLWSGGSTFKAQGDISVWRRARA